MRLVARREVLAVEDQRYHGYHYKTTRVYNLTKLLENTKSGTCEPLFLDEKYGQILRTEVGTSKITK